MDRLREEKRAIIIIIFVSNVNQSFILVVRQLAIKFDFYHKTYTLTILFVCRTCSVIESHWLSEWMSSAIERCWSDFSGDCQNVRHFKCWIGYIYIRTSIQRNDYHKHKKKKKNRTNDEKKKRIKRKRTDKEEKKETKRRYSLGMIIFFCIYLQVILKIRIKIDPKMYFVLTKMMPMIDVSIVMALVYE